MNFRLDFLDVPDQGHLIVTDCADVVLTVRSPAEIIHAVLVVGEPTGSYVGFSGVNHCDKVLVISNHSDIVVAILVPSDSE